MASPCPYLIFYEVNDAEDEVVIIAVRDYAGFRAAMIYGYARVLTDAQDLASHLAALKAVGCARIFREKISGAPAERP
jgi:Resolvase, N terminal domain